MAWEKDGPSSMAWQRERRRRRRRSTGAVRE
jgi:hypothetical protein